MRNNLCYDTIYAEKFLYVTSIYDLSIILKFILIFVVAVLSIKFIKEYEIIKESNKISIKKHIKTSISILKTNKILILIFISIFSTGFFLFLLETYWQPQLVSLLPNDAMLWIFGIVSSLCFISAMCGNLMSDIITIKYRIKPITLYNISRILLGLLILIMATQNNYLSFIAFYILVYLLLGLANISEGVLINSIIPSENRASILSFNSLIVQLGSLLASFISSFFINYISISLIWMVGAIGVIIAIVILISNSKK